jgi:hypothetical protein
MTTKNKTTDDIAANIAEELNNWPIYREISPETLKKAKNGGCLIVFAENSYQVKVLGDHEKLTGYPNSGVLYLRPDEFFINPICFHYRVCQYVKQRKRKARKFVFKNERDASDWICETDVKGAYFDLAGEGGSFSRGIVFHKDELKPRYTDSELLDFLEKLNEERLYTGKVVLRISQKGRGFRLRETSQAGAASSVRQAIIDFMKTDEYIFL